MAAAEGEEWDYVVVGSGAGGGTLAARLALGGWRVLVLEAGSDPKAAGAGADDGRSGADDYDVPAFHPFASEDPAASWRMFVEHYGDPAQAARDPKRQPQGIYYPRAGALGGCTGHNAMIFMRPHNSDWDAIAEATGDASWRAPRMQRYWKMIERRRYGALADWLARLGLDRSGHGWRGWLPTERAMPMAAFGDDELLATVAASVLADWGASPRPLASLAEVLADQADPNDLGFQSREGVVFTPLSTLRHRRRGTRERLLDVARRHPERLKILTDALACEILLDESGQARGVAYLAGRGLYGASATPASGPGERREVIVRREVIICAGAFGTPQLLMLSGIGEGAALTRLGIRPRIEAPGVGRNLQDRYEIAVINRMARPWSVLSGARFAAGDPLFDAWRRGSGMYVSNGAALAVIHRSAPDLIDPDIFAMAMLARFEGYYPGYSRALEQHHDTLTWALLKAHTRNRAGTVRLASADPRRPPAVNFAYFDPADDPAQDDLAAVVWAIRRVRAMTAPLIASGVIAAEEAPGPGLVSDADLSAYVRDNAWGHHACGTAQIGAPGAGGVLDSAFRVHGARGLRVADASVFPRIPGFFIAAPIYMIAEKAAEAVAADGGRG